MSGRMEGDRSPDRRRRSGFDREPSPKRSRRDAKPDAERAHDVPHSNYAERREKHGRQPRDTSSREVPLVSDRRAEGSIQNKDSNEKNHKSSDDTKVPSNPTEVPRSESYFQHDERGTAGLGGRSSSRRENAERGWWKDSRDRGSDSAARELHQRGKAPRREAGKDDKVWAHDGFFEMEANPPPPPQLPLNLKRPAFREQKIAADNNQNDRNGRNEDHKPGNGGNRVSNFERRDERGGRRERYPDRFEKFSPRGGGRPYRRDERQIGPYGSRDRYGGGNGRFGGSGRESNSGQPPLHSAGGRVEKWKHDMYDEANKSPPPKNDEDRLAKIETLLAS